jgi:hypothetical protein
MHFWLSSHCNSQSLLMIILLTSTLSPLAPKAGTDARTNNAIRFTAIFFGAWLSPFSFALKSVEVYAGK